MVFGAFVAFFSLFFLVVTSVERMPQDLSSAQVGPAAIRFILIAIFGIPAAVSIWLLFYLTRPNVARQFDAARREASVTGGKRSTPTSVLIVGWYLILSTVFESWVLIVPVPAFFFSVLLVGRAAHLLFLAYGIAHVVLGIGLLRLKNWARIGTIAYFALYAINSLIAALVPETSAQFEAAMGPFRRAFGSPPGPVHAHLWLGPLVSVPITVAVTWVLVTRRAVFLQNSIQSPAAPLETTP
ncbi:MAG: hypothetical protein ACRD8A_19955 [Candidatus Acidiferrales bacterium]